MVNGTDKLYKTAELFKVFGDTTRLKILFALFSEEMCVTDISEQVQMSNSAVSHQLKTLRHTNLVRFRREGKSTVYSLADDHVRTLLMQALEHINE